MSVEFRKAECLNRSERKIFGLCDDPPPNTNPAYIDELDGGKWIATVENEDQHPVVFTAIDNCIEIRRADGTMEQRCDGMLEYKSTVIFIELKQRISQKNRNAWVEDAEPQLKATISEFEKTELSETFSTKKAYISNCEHPKFKVSQTNRMNKFALDTGYVLRVEARIRLEFEHLQPL